MGDFSLPPGFVYVDEVVDAVHQSLRYSSEHNFLGRQIRGYFGERAIMTIPAANALKVAQQEFLSRGLCIVIYDTYRPQQAVDNFYEWSLDASDTVAQGSYYPRIDKANVFELGYVARRSGHSRGSTIDLSVVELSRTLVHPPVCSNRTFTLGDSSFDLPYLDDSTLDMGTSFDLMDAASHINCCFISESAQRNRQMLREVMISAGFRPYDEEWWHFTLQDEPFPDTYFDFEVR